VKLRDLHPWVVSPAEAAQIQRMLSPQVIRRGEPAEVRLIAGVDISVDASRRRGIGAVIVLSYPDLQLVEASIEEADLSFPYVPGLLSFRETPVLRSALEKLSNRPDLLIADAQGLAHPRRFGLACHLGLLLDLPTIGCAKSRLIGEHWPLGEEVGSRADLTDEGEVIGSVLRTRSGTRPVFVSIGHRISLRAAEEWVLRCCKGYRLPEPTRLAHQAAGGQLKAPVRQAPSQEQLRLL